MLPILIFAHVPPPHHGQSYMVAQLLEELRATPEEITVYHVDSRVSDHLEEVGRAGGGKVLRLVGHCLKAIYLRLRWGPMIFYYVPAPAKRAALYRDWLVLLLCRPFFRRRVVFHWHAVGLGEWVRTRAGFFTALLTRRLLGGADLCLVLAKTVADDARVFVPRRVVDLANGIPDPCADFMAALLPVRIARASAPCRTFRVLFLAHCTREKGLYEALEGVFTAQRQADSENTGLRFSLTVAGQFLSQDEHTAFLERVTKLGHEVISGGSLPSVEYVGFAAGGEKDLLFRESDCFCFPTYYPNEVMPVTLIEALAYGLPIVSTRWRAIPEMLPAEGCTLVAVRRADEVAAGLRHAVETTAFQSLREHFMVHFQRDVFGRRFRTLLSSCFSGAGETTREGSHE